MNENTINKPKTNLTPNLINSTKIKANDLTLTSTSFGFLSSGKEAQLFTLSNNQNITVNITNYGAAIVAINTPDKKGKFADIVLGYDTVAGYENDTDYLGAIIGRYAGRIKNGRVNINEQNITLSLNHENSQLHGGNQALNKQLWHVNTEMFADGVTLTLTHTSPDGDNGFIGEVEFCIKYSLNIKNEFSVEYFASTNKTTLTNLTQHSYFNLAGHDQGNILNHQVQLNADYFLPMDDEAYPTGEKILVNNTAHNFTQLTTLSSAMDGSNQQIKIAKGYDNYWLVNQSKPIQSLQEYVARVVEPISGRQLTLYSDQPSVILYTGNYLNTDSKTDDKNFVERHLKKKTDNFLNKSISISDKRRGKNNTTYQAQQGLCLEPQRAFNHSISNDNYQAFASCLLTPEQPFYSKSIYVFDVIKKR